MEDAEAPWRPQGQPATPGDSMPTIRRLEARDHAAWKELFAGYCRF
jgi:hypothetical protein